MGSAMILSPALAVEGFATGYNARRVIDYIDLEVAKQEIVAIIGHNGAGKSTLLKAIFGMIPTWGGKVRIYGRLLRDPSPRQMMSLGVGYLPQGNRVFGELTVKENLEVAGRLLGSKRSVASRVDSLATYFPSIRAHFRRPAATLSGGEKQIVALASSLMLSPRVLLLDEPSLGLAPPLAEVTFRHLVYLSRETGVSMLVAEQKVREILEIADRVYVLRNGSVSFEGSASALGRGSELPSVYL